MFRIVCFVDDKRLAAVMHALSGLVVSMAPPQPVQNAEIVGKGKTAKIAAKGNGKLISLFADHLKDMATGTELRPKDIAAWLKKAGMSPASASYLVKQAAEAGLIKKTGQSSAVRYHVQGGK